MTVLMHTTPMRATAPSTVPSAARDLIAGAQRSLAEAIVAPTPAERYACAHLSALRGAAAVLAARGRPSSRRSRVRSVWAVLPEVAPEFTEWAGFFAAGARTRAAAEVGIACVSMREADDLVRDADAFLARVTGSLGLPYQSMLLAARG